MQQAVQRKEITRIAPALMTDLQQLAGLAHRLHHGARALDRIAHHLFAVHIQAGLEACVGHRRMPEIGRGDNHRLKIFFLRQQVLVIFVGADFVASFFR